MLTDAQEALRDWARERATGAEWPRSFSYWLSDREWDDYTGGCLADGDDCGEFCRECVFNAPVLVPLTMCLLLDLIGLNGSGPRPHTMPDGRYCARRCDTPWLGDCWSIAEEIADRIRSARDGGWRMDADGIRFCSACGVELDVSLTEYAAQEELSHFEDYPPRCPDDFRYLGNALDAADEKTWARFLEIAPAWGFTAPRAATK